MSEKMIYFIARKGQLFVSDVGNYRILSFPYTTVEGSPDGTTIIGRAGAGPALTQINLVYSMTIDHIRHLFYISDFQNHRILQLNLTNNTMQLVAGIGSAGSTNASLNLPLGVTVERDTGSIYVADSRNHRIQKFDLNSAQGQTVAGGRGNGTNLTQLATPGGLALDPSGNIYIADSANNRIVQWITGAQQGRMIAGE